jgi:hypothetical protein
MRKVLFLLPKSLYTSLNLCATYGGIAGWFRPTTTQSELKIMP